jgi:hypothetical protein
MNKVGHHPLARFSHCTALLFLPFCPSRTGVGGEENVKSCIGHLSTHRQKMIPASSKLAAPLKKKTCGHCVSHFNPSGC